MKKLYFLISLTLIPIIAFSQKVVELDSKKYSINIDSFEQGIGIIYLDERLENGERRPFKPEKGNYFFESKKERFDFSIDDKGQFVGTADYTKKDKILAQFVFENGKVILVTVDNVYGNRITRIEINDSIFISKGFDEHTNVVMEQLIIKNGGGRAKSIETNFFPNGNKKWVKDNIAKTRTSYYENGKIEEYQNDETKTATEYNEKGKITYQKYWTKTNERCEEFFDDNHIITRKECTSSDGFRDVSYYYKNGKYSMRTYTFGLIIPICLGGLYMARHCNSSATTKVIGHTQPADKGNNQQAEPDWATNFTVEDERNIATKDSLIDAILELVANQKLVKKQIHLIDSLSNGKRHISLVPFLDDSLNNIYLVKVGENNGTNLVTYFNFLVDANTMTIKNPTGKLHGQ